MSGFLSFWLVGVIGSIMVLVLKDLVEDVKITFSDLTIYVLASLFLWFVVLAELINVKSTKCKLTKLFSKAVPFGNKK